MYSSTEPTLPKGRIALALKTSDRVLEEACLELLAPRRHRTSPAAFVKHRRCSVGPHTD